MPGTRAETNNFSIISHLFFSPPPVSSHGGEREKEIRLSGVSPYKDSNLIASGTQPMTSFNLNYVSVVPIQI